MRLSTKCLLLWNKPPWIEHSSPAVSRTTLHSRSRRPYNVRSFWLPNVHHNIVHPLSFFFRRPLLCGRLCRSLRWYTTSSSRLGVVVLSLRMICRQRSMKTSSTFASWNQQSTPSLIDRLTPLPGRRLVIWSISPTLWDGECFLPCHHPVLFEVWLVANNDDGDVLVILDADDLLSEFLEFLKAALAGDREDEQKSLSCLHVQLSRFRSATRRLFSPPTLRASYLIAAVKSQYGHVTAIFFNSLNCSVPAVSNLNICEPHVASSMEYPTSQACIDDPGMSQLHKHRHDTLTAGLTSTSICFRYESSIVGS